jgi:hypothetical protein
MQHMAKNGTKAKRKYGRAGVQTFIYPRPAAWALFEKAAKQEQIRLGQWLQLAALEKIARGGALNRKAIKALIPAEDFDELQRQRGMSLA